MIKDGSNTFAYKACDPSWEFTETIFSNSKIGGKYDYDNLHGKKADAYWFEDGK